MPTETTTKIEIEPMNTLEEILTAIGWEHTPGVDVRKIFDEILERDRMRSGASLPHLDVGIEMIKELNAARQRIEMEAFEKWVEDNPSIAASVPQGQGLVGSMTRASRLIKLYHEWKSTSRTV